jgi:hypothetical protein
MKDIKGFCKLYDLNIPEFKEFDYYISQYKRIDRWKDMDTLLELFRDLESKVDNVLEYKVAKSNEIIAYIKDTRTYSEMCLENFIKDYPSKNIEYKEDTFYLSIDINTANWLAIKKYEPPFLKELGETYNDLLDRFEVHESLKRSKQFRQYIFGNLNPRKQVRVQRSIIEDFITKYNHIGLDISGIKQDEVIYTFNNKEDISEIVNTLDTELFKYKIYKVERKEDFRIHYYFNEELESIHSEIVGCNGNKYFIFLKKYLLKEELDVRDLYFRVDKDLAIWNVENLEKSLV